MRPLRRTMLILLVILASGPPEGAEGAARFRQRYEASTSGWRELSDDFSKLTDRWPSGEDDRGDQWGYANGKYRILIKVKPGQIGAGVIAGMPLSGMPPKVQFEKLAIEADVVQQTGPSDVLFGLSCGSTPDTLYVFLINAQGHYFIFFDDGPKGKSELLQSGRAPTRKPVYGLGENNRFRAECSGGSGNATFVLSINGKRIAKAIGRKNETFQFTTFFVTTLHAIANSTRTAIPGVNKEQPGSPKGFDAEFMFDNFLLRALPTGYRQNGKTPGH